MTSIRVGPCPSTTSSATPTSTPSCSTCTQDRNLVCGIDKKTYLNPCHARCRGMNTFTPGACTTTTTTTLNLTEINRKIEELGAKINSTNVDQINAQLEEIKKQLIASQNREIKDQEQMKKQKNMYYALFVAIIVLLVVLYVKK